MPKDPTKCQHEEFHVEAIVNRLLAVKGDLVSGYNVDIKVECAECDLPFRFKGVPVGYDPARPMTEFGGEELRAPIEPVPFCHKCGCSDFHACVEADGPCHWVEPNLCSACDKKIRDAARA